MIKLSYKQSCLVDDDVLDIHLKQLQTEIAKVKKTDQKYLSPFGFIYLPFDTTMLTEVQNCITKKRALQPALCIVVGIGGSNLGTLAIQQAVQGILFNELGPPIKLYFADTVDASYIEHLVALVEQELKQGNNIIINVVSKSGTTTETIANFEVFLRLLKHYHPDNYQDYVVVTTDKGSKLWNLGQQEKFSCLTIPEQVGGRYSVFSAVGLFPLGLVGISLDQLLEGARSITGECIKETEDNGAAASASVLYEWYKKGIDIFDLFLFSVELEGVGKWYRQLVGESIGKEQDTQGKEVRISIVPTVSIGSTDLHSIGQRYFGGKKTIGTTLVTVKEPKRITLPDYPLFNELVPNIQGKYLSSIMDAIVNGVQAAYTREKLPFMHVELLKKDAYYLGQFLQYKMIEVVYLAYLLGVNPFDQPAVETYKQETRKLLANG